MNETSQFWIGIAPILFIMVATLAFGGYEVFKIIKRPKQ